MQNATNMEYILTEKKQGIAFLQSKLTLDDHNKK